MQVLRGHEPGRSVWGLAFAPDGQRLVSCSNDRTVRLWDLTTGVSEVLERQLADFATFSPDGAWLAHGFRSHVRLLELAGPRRLNLSCGRGFPCLNAAFTPDSQTLVVGAGVQEFAVATGVLQRRWDGVEDANGALALSSDGRLLATAHAQRLRLLQNGRAFEHSVTVWDYARPGLRRLLQEPARAVRALAFAPGGQLLAATSEPDLWVWDTSTGKVVFHHAESRRHYKAVAFAPDGRWLATVSNDRTVRLYSTLTWLAEMEVDWLIGPCIAVAFAPDGMRAAASSKRGLIAVWDVDP